MIKIRQKERKNERFRAGDRRERWGTLRAELEKPQGSLSAKGSSLAAAQPGAVMWADE